VKGLLNQNDIYDFNSLGWLSGLENPVRLPEIP